MCGKTITKIELIVIILLAGAVFLFLNANGPGNNLASVAGTPQKPQAQKPVTIIFGGDVMLGRTVMTTSQDKGDYVYPFRNIAQTLRQADISFVNLENPFVYGCRRDYTSMVFCAVPEMTHGLVFSGIDIVTLANNHSRNYGQEGIDTTVNVLAEKGILATGLGELVSIEKEGVVFGFLGFEFLSQEPTDADYKLVRKANALVDVLLVSPHWGVEYGKPTQAQRAWAKRLIAEGADLIVGHHPHVVQSKDITDNVPVYYSLGNLIFDQMWSEATRKGMLLEVTFSEGKLSERIINTYMDNWAQPVIKPD